MRDKYRRLLATYRRRMEREPRFRPTRALAPEQAEALVQLAKRLNENSDDGRFLPDRRGSRRHPLEQFVLVTPWSTPDNPRMIETRTAVVKDISTGGLSFVQPGAFTDPGFLVTLSVPEMAPVCLSAQVRRMEPVRIGFYLVGGEFEERVSLGDEHDQHGRTG